MVVPNVGIGSVLDGGGGDEGGGELAAAATVNDAEPVFPPLDARIVTVPAPTDVASPLAFTVAIAELLLVHVIDCPLSTEPVELMTCAENCAVCPTELLTGLGVTITDATVTPAGGAAGAAGAAEVAALATFDSEPNTALPLLSEPRNATTWN